MTESRAELRRGGLILVVCVLVAHAGSLRNGFHYDDEHSLLENPHVRSLAELPRCLTDPGCFSGMPEARMYRPLVLATYTLNYAAGGYAPLGYRLVNLILHLLVCLASWRLFRILVPDAGAALTAALVLGLHPLCTEPVSYVSARSSVLATLFVVLGMWVLVRRAEAPRPWRTAALLAVCQLAALGAKEIGMVLPLLGAVWLASRRPPAVVEREGSGSSVGVRQSARSWVLLAAPAAVCLVYLAATRAILGKALLEPVRPLGVQAATQLKALGFYLWKVAAPLHLSVEPQFGAADASVEAAGVAALLLAGSLLWLAAQQRHRNPTVWLGCCWFGLALLPSSLVPLNVLVNEHRLYLSLVGAALALAGLLATVSPRVRRLLWPVLALFGLLCAQRHPVWQSGERLWADAVAQGPRMPRPYVNLGKAYLESGRLREAIAISRRALDLDPGLARAHYNIGTAHLRLAEPDLAVADYRRALELQPDLVPALHNLGTAFQEQGLFRQAVAAYRQALALQPTASGYHNLGAAFLEQGQPDSARVAFLEALRLDPELREAHKGLAKALLSTLRPDAAREALDQSLAQWPQDPELLQLFGDAAAALGDESGAADAYLAAGKDSVTVLLLLGDQARKRQDWSRALTHYEEALRRDEANPLAHQAVAELLARDGRIAEALEAFRRAARLAPELVAPYLGIGRLYLARGRGLEAAAAFERAVSLAPKDGQPRALLGEALRQVGKVQAALEAYREAVELAPARAELHHNLGHLLEQAGHLEQAEAAYRAALERDPELTESRFSLGHLLLGRGEYAQAATAFEQVLARTPTRAEGHLNLATALLGLGRRIEAVAEYRRFLALHPEPDATRQRVIAELARLGGP